jgi:hypothetical protein
MLIGVCAHPINTDAHATVPPGWRWAVHVGDNWADLGSCLNAGWEPSKSSALLAGEAAGVCAVKVARLFGAARMDTFEIDHDPIDAGNDLIQIGA